MISFDRRNILCPKLPSPRAAATATEVLQFKEYVEYLRNPEILANIWSDVQPLILRAIAAKETCQWREERHALLLSNRSHFIALRDGKITPESYFMALGASDASDIRNPYFFLADKCNNVLNGLQGRQKAVRSQGASEVGGDALAEQVFFNNRKTPEEIALTLCDYFNDTEVRYFSDRSLEQVHAWVRERLEYDFRNVV